MNGKTKPQTNKIMKNNKLFLAFALSALVAAALIAGCATPNVTPAQPAQPAVTNATTGVVTPPVAAVPAVTNGYSTNAQLTAAAPTVSAIAGVIPSPYGNLLNGLFTLVMFGAGAIAAYKNKQLQTVQAVQDTIIQGVEAAGSVAAAVKQSVAKTAAANGTADAVEAAVNKVTGAQ